MAICWERAVPLAFHLCCFYFSAILIVCVPFPFGVQGRMWNLIVSVPDHCLFIYFTLFSVTHPLLAVSDGELTLLDCMAVRASTALLTALIASRVDVKLGPVPGALVSAFSLSLLDVGTHMATIVWRMFRFPSQCSCSNSWTAFWLAENKKWHAWW